MPKRPTHYVVSLLVRSGEYEKHMTKLVKASNEKLAGRRAIEGEMHHGFKRGGEWDDPDKQSAYDGWQHWYYRVKETRPVSDEDLETLKKYFR